jgi:hypothetical protein
MASGRLLTVAGMIIEAADSANKEHVVCAIALVKVCSVPLPESSFMLTRPPSRKLLPMTRRRLDRMEPSIDDCTTSISFFFRATILTMSSTALPKVAFSSPPNVSPSGMEISSVAKDNTAARGIMAMKFSENTAAGLQPSTPAMIPSGTNGSRTLT